MNFKRNKTERKKLWGSLKQSQIIQWSSLWNRWKEAKGAREREWSSNGKIPKCNIKSRRFVKNHISACHFTLHMAQKHTHHAAHIHTRSRAHTVKRTSKCVHSLFQMWILFVALTTTISQLINTEIEFMTFHESKSDAISDDLRYW